jgi:hypothetical protein
MRGSALLFALAASRPTGTLKLAIRMFDCEVVSAATWIRAEVARMAPFRPRWTRDDLHRLAVRRGDQPERAVGPAIDELIAAGILAPDPDLSGVWMPGPHLYDWQPQPPEPVPSSPRAES